MTDNQITVNKKLAFKTEVVFPVIVAGISLLNISSHLEDLISLTNLLSLVGIVGTILYFKKNDRFRKLIYIWVLAQVIVIDREVLLTETGNWIDKPLWDLTQFFSVKFGFNITTATNRFGFNVNIIALFFFGLLKILVVSRLIGKQLTFKKFRADNKLGDIFPLTGTVIKRVTISQKKDWLLVHLSSTFNYAGNTINYVLVKNKDGAPIKQKVKNQLVYFRLVKDLNDLVEENNDSKKFPFIDWARCE